MNLFNRQLDIKIEKLDRASKRALAAYYRLSSENSRFYRAAAEDGSLGRVWDEIEARAAAERQASAAYIRFAEAYMLACRTRHARVTYRTADRARRMGTTPPPAPLL